MPPPPSIDRYSVDYVFTLLLKDVVLTMKDGEEIKLDLLQKEILATGEMKLSEMVIGGCEALAPNPFQRLHFRQPADLHGPTQGVSYSLSHYSLADAPTFYALSYVWGTGSFSERIQVDEKSLSVTSHLLAGLAVLKRQFGPTLFWIDTICIDKSNDAEKTDQISRMTNIYS
ncbi:heterokaryon incompatibility protein-domain-containing protein [Lasiosphaeria miniovina]|uniref:Heterokaryon incompatibility protein-domain-containing protein n=1 Tax=Lasiosphaeria miniovina TaxID=1954250 RepID=A0AA40B4N7_9PEZI|nr:heterokaryon incompatibility protein-domain-containing protein [Lasiosphaeria miniovina]KAK0727542.1 heterokaryon incompatibility protein-domain-containing protein [Lasiosphaeria miniovina]